MVPHWEKYIKDLRKKGNSVGAMIEIVVKGVPAGLGALSMQRWTQILLAV